MLKLFEQVYQFQKENPMLWFNSNNFTGGYRSDMHLKFLLFLREFGITYLRSSYHIGEKSYFSLYNIKIKNMERGKNFRNILIDSLKEKNKYVTYHCKKFKVVTGAKYLELVR